jgi:hypothetical protein
MPDKRKLSEDLPPEPETPSSSKRPRQSTNSPSNRKSNGSLQGPNEAAQSKRLRNSKSQAKSRYGQEPVFPGLDEEEDEDAANEDSQDEIGQSTRDALAYLRMVR